MNAVTPRFNVVARNWIKLGLKRPLSFAAGSLCAARNWIKLGLKRSPSRVVAICISSRNWIKLGLKHDTPIWGLFSNYSSQLD